jgi:hypothetical protein
VTTLSWSNRLKPDIVKESAEQISRAAVHMSGNFLACRLLTQWYYTPDPSIVSFAGNGFLRPPNLPFS